MILCSFSSKQILSLKESAFDFIVSPLAPGRRTPFLSLTLQTPPLFLLRALAREQRLRFMSSDSNHDRGLFVKFQRTQRKLDDLPFRIKPAGVRSLGAIVGRWHPVHSGTVLSDSWNVNKALPVRGARRGWRPFATGEGHLPLAAAAAASSPVPAQASARIC